MDDGYQSNSTLAFPVLKELELPATIFISTAFVEQEELLWPDRLEFAINKSGSSTFELKKTTESKIRSELKSVPQDLRSEIIGNLESQLGGKLSLEGNIPEIYRPLNWEEISRMIQSGLISIGSHTHTHVILTRCDEEKMRKELMLSKEIIQRKTGLDGRLFCYPNGEVGDFNLQTKEVLKETGYACGLTTVQGFNDKSSDVFELKRFGVRNQTDEVEFIMTLCRIKKFISDLKQFFFHEK